MPNNTLYLLGAGASAQALPLVKGTSDGSIRGLAYGLMALSIRMQNEHPEGFSGNFIKYIRSKFEWLEQESHNYQTIDTYARNLYLTGEKIKLKNLKTSLAIYFVLEQIHLKKLDRRYSIWLSSIIQQPQLFPESIRILTWNYDFQLQLAATKFREEKFHYGEKVSVSTPPLVKYYPPTGNIFPHTTKDYNPFDFNTIHLNGIAGLFLEAEKNYFDNIFIRNQDIISDLERFIECSDSFTHLLTFAWETSSAESIQIKRRLEFAKRFTEDVTTLIVIGYSFPWFNKDIDVEIFNTLKENKTLKKIYLQDPNAEQSKNIFYDQFGFDSKEVRVIPITQVESFYIPYEL